MKELVEIQAALNAPKNQFNKFGGYTYRSCEDILTALKPLAASRGCFVTLYDEIVAVGNRIYVRATACITNSEGEQVCATAYAREAEEKKGMDDAQVTGSASSYARKYALNGLFAIDDAKDADATNTHGKDAPVAAPKAVKPVAAPKAATKPVLTPSNEKHWKNAVAKLRNKQTTPDKVKEVYTISDDDFAALMDETLFGEE